MLCFKNYTFNLEKRTPFGCWNFWEQAPPAPWFHQPSSWLCPFRGNERGSRGQFPRSAVAIYKGPNERLNAPVRHKGAHFAHFVPSLCITVHAFFITCIYGLKYWGHCPFPQQKGACFTLKGHFSPRKRALLGCWIYFGGAPPPAPRISSRSGCGLEECSSDGPYVILDYGWIYSRLRYGQVRRYDGFRAVKVQSSVVWP